MTWKVSLPRHAGIASSAFAQGQSGRSIVPMDGDERICALLVGVGVARIAVEAEVAVGAAIDTEFKRRIRRLPGVFVFRPKGQNRTGPDVERNVVERRLRFDVLIALELRAGPEVVPSGGRRQIHRTTARSLLCDRIHEKRGAKGVFVANVADLLVFAPVHHQRSHHGVVLAGDAPCQGVDVGQQPGAQLVVSNQRRRLRSVGENLIGVVRPVPMGAKDGAERTELIPARVELLVVGVARVALVRPAVAGNVRRPVGQAGSLKVQPRGNLTPERHPCPDNIP
jgi:hypothetical protein